MFQLDVKHALEKWSFFGISFAPSATFLFSPNRALYNGAPKTIRRVHYFSGENANKITAILMVALPTLLRYLCDGLTSSFSYRTICRTCNLHYLIIIISTLVFFSWLIYSFIFFTVFGEAAALFFWHSVPLFSLPWEIGAFEYFYCISVFQWQEWEWKKDNKRHSNTWLQRDNEN